MGTRRFFFCLSLSFPFPPLPPFVLCGVKNHVNVQNLLHGNGKTKQSVDR